MKPEWLYDVGFGIRLASYGPYPIWAGIKLRRMALDAGLHPIPLNRDFIFDVTLRIEQQRRTFSYNRKSFGELVRGTFALIVKRLADPSASIERYSEVDIALRDHGIAPIPPIIERPSSPMAWELEVRETMQSIFEEISAARKNK
ncbi:MAG: hypothetical protein ABSC72_11680 [Methylovirgula sp.]|jgi:hypothetical protein